MIDPISSFASKLTSGVGSDPTRVAPNVSTTGGADFGAALAQVASDAAQSLKTAEAASIAGMEGRMSAQKVVEAVLAAEQNLQSAVAIRDKVVNAYLELTRMAI